MPDSPNSNTNNTNKGCGRRIIILIILILIFFFWHFINYTDVNWTGNITNQTQPSQLPNDIPISDGPSERPAGGVQRSYPKTSTDYNCEYLRWSGKLMAGEYAVWGKISIEQKEIPVGGNLYPLSPSRIYGNIREFNGVGVNLMIFSEENYLAWINGNKQSAPMIATNGISDYNYSFGIDYGSYFIVVKNSSQNEAFIGFTGVHIYQRVVDAGEIPYSNPNPPNCYWTYKKEKLTLFEYLLKILNPSNSVSVTPPSIGKD